MPASPKVVYPSEKTDIALELYDRARAQKVHFEWLTFDEWYGSKPPFLRELDTRKQKFIGEKCTKSCMAWIDQPKKSRLGRGARQRRSSSQDSAAAGRQSKAQTVEQLANSHPAQIRGNSRRGESRTARKGPIVWQVKHVSVIVPDSQGLPGSTYHLLVCRNPDWRDQILLQQRARRGHPSGNCCGSRFRAGMLSGVSEDQEGGSGPGPLGGPPAADRS